jgi:hypothetical protein
MPLMRDKLRVVQLLLSLALLSAPACSADELNDQPDAMAAARSDAAAPYDRPEPPDSCDQPDGPCRTPCNFDEAPLCPGTQVCVITCEYGVVAQYCREPNPSALAPGEMCMPGIHNCRAGGCMQEARASGPRCTSFCVVDEDCPTDTHCVASTFSFGCETGREVFEEGLCRALSIAAP